MWQKLSMCCVAVVSAALLLTGCGPFPGNASPSPSNSATSFVTPLPSTSPSGVESSTADPTPSASTGGGSEVEVTFVTLDVVDGVIEATGIVTGVVESGGACTLEIRRDGDSRQVSIESAAGPVSTYCGLMTIPVEDLANGEWTAVIEYASSSSHGRSGSQVVSIQ